MVVVVEEEVSERREGRERRRAAYLLSLLRERVGLGRGRDDLLGVSHDVCADVCQWMREMLRRGKGCYCGGEETACGFHCRSISWRAEKRCSSSICTRI